MRGYKRLIATIMVLVIMTGVIASCAKNDSHHGSNSILEHSVGEATTETEETIVETPTPIPTPSETEPSETESGVWAIGTDIYTEFCGRMQQAGFSEIEGATIDESAPIQNIALNKREYPIDDTYYSWHLEAVEEVECPAGLMNFINTFNSLSDTDMVFAHMAYPSTILRSDSRVLSIRFRSYDYAELYPDDMFIVNIDSQTGAILTLDDVANDYDSLISEGVALFQANYSQDITPDLSRENILWSMGYEGLDIIFCKDDYSMGMSNGPRTYGCITFNSANYGDVINSYYLETPDEYEVEFNRYFDVNYDIGHDGTFDDIRFNYDYYNTESDMININGQSSLYYDDDSNFVTYGSFIHRGNNDYVAIYTDNASDDGPFRIYNLSNLDVVFDEEVSYGTDFVSPSIIRIIRDVSMLGNLAAYTDYTFNSDGTFEYNDPYYHISYYMSVISTVVDLDCQLVDSDGNYIEDFVLPAGSEIYPYRHNGYDFEDVIYDGQIVRIFFEVEEEDGGFIRRTVNGYSLYNNEAFTNLWWAD